MPIFRYECSFCGAFEDLSDGENHAECPRCGEMASRTFTPTKNVIVPEYMKAENSDSDAARRHRAWVNSPEVQADLKSGRATLVQAKGLGFDEE